MISDWLLDASIVRKRIGHNGSHMQVQYWAPVGPNGADQLIYAFIFPSHYYAIFEPLEGGFYG